MKKLGLVIKKQSESIVKDRLNDSQAAFIIRYTGLSAADLSILRRDLSGVSASLMVVKNSVAQRALKDAGKDALLDTIDGPCGVIFSKDEPVTVAKIVYDFAKTHQNLQVAGGFLDEKILEEKDVEYLSKLPSLEVLRAQFVMTINAPRVSLVRALHYTLRKLVICLDKIKEKKDA